jgi:hypothetical protein
MIWKKAEVRIYNVYTKNEKKFSRFFYTYFFQITKGAKKNTKPDLNTN